jgi:hypothetical protein
MIHETLAADVEFARSMINSSHSDAEILAHLASRGLEPTQAAHLVEDLRHGRQPSVQLPVVPFPAGHHTPGRAKGARTHSHHEYHPPRPQSRSGSHRRSGIPWWFVLLVLVFGGALLYAFLEAGKEASKDAVNHQRHEVPTAPGR